MSDELIGVEALDKLKGTKVQADTASKEEQDKTFAKESREQEVEQARLKNETLRLENDNLGLKNANLTLENQTSEDNNTARKSFASKIFWLTVVWLLIVVLLLVCAGRHWLELSEKVLIALITSGSINVLAFFLNVTKYLYHNDK